MDKALKQRMVGASVLIALAVIVLPMLLGGRPDSETHKTRKIELPAQPVELSFETRRYPISEAGSEQQVKTDPSAQDEPARPLPVPKIPMGKADQPHAADSTLVKSGTDQPKPPVSQPASGQLDKVPDSGRYIVQVASFGALNNANKLAARLRSNGYSVMTDSIKSDVGILNRVRVGPYASEAEARLAVLDLESKVRGVKPRIMDLEPGKKAQITTPSDPLIRWIVQVGSFSSAANAEKLVTALRQDGLSAYQETLSSADTSIYRVRIGPFLQREDAVNVEQQVREKRSLEGVVMSAD